MRRHAAQICRLRAARAKEAQMMEMRVRGAQDARLRCFACRDVDAAFLLCRCR